MLGSWPLVITFMAEYRVALRGLSTIRHSVVSPVEAMPSSARLIVRLVNIVWDDGSERLGSSFQHVLKLTDSAKKKRKKPLFGKFCL